MSSSGHTKNYKKIFENTFKFMLNFLGRKTRTYEDKDQVG